MKEEYDDSCIIAEVGKIARFIDSEMTIFERMKIKKTSLFKISFALLFYVITMIVFSIFL